MEHPVDITVFLQEVIRNGHFAPIQSQLPSARWFVGHQISYREVVFGDCDPLAVIDQAFRSAALSAREGPSPHPGGNPAERGQTAGNGACGHHGAAGAAIPELSSGGSLETAPAAEERSVRRRLLPGGMVRLEPVLEPDEAELILRAVQRAREVQAEQGAETDEEPAGETTDWEAFFVLLSPDDRIPTRRNPLVGGVS